MPNMNTRQNGNLVSGIDYAQAKVFLLASVASRKFSISSELLEDRKPQYLTASNELF